MRGVAWLTVAAGLALSVLAGLLVAAVLNTWLADYWVRGIATSAIGIFVAIELARGVVATHIGSVKRVRNPQGR